MSGKAKAARDHLTKLEEIPNIGPSIARCLRRVGIREPKDLQTKDPYELYDQLCDVDNERYDPCVLDVFMAATDFMNGSPKKPWWKYTTKRKRELAQREESKPRATRMSIGRRALLANGALLLLSSRSLQAMTRELEPLEKTILRFTMLTDLHYADKPPGGTRFYRETLTKLEKARPSIEKFRPDFVVELGDVIDAAESVEEEKKYLATIHERLKTLPSKNHYVVGNHCVYWLTKAEFLEVVGQQKTFYSFDVGSVHLVVLDACFRGDGEPYGRKNFQWTDSNLSQDQLQWLKADLKQQQKPTIVFIHQRLDVEGHYGVKNAEAVRKILEESNQVLAVFQGHNHKNDYREINGIHYCTLSAMVEGSGQKNSALANATVDSDGNIQVVGFFQQKSYSLSG